MDTLEMGTELFQRMAKFDYGEGERGDLMRKVWSPTPWMLNIWTGRWEDGREQRMLEWCYRHFGQESSPIHDRDGKWKRGNATVMGWTWFGFSTQEEMNQFVSAWPSPVERTNHRDT